MQLQSQAIPNEIQMEVRRPADPTNGFRLEVFIDRYALWSQQAIGPGQRTEGVLKHIAKELDEVRANPDDLEEWVDLINLAIDGATRRGFSGKDIIKGLLDKFMKLQDRKFNQVAEDQPCEHIREERMPIYPAEWTEG